MKEAVVVVAEIVKSSWMIVLKEKLKNENDKVNEKKKKERKK